MEWTCQAVSTSSFVRKHWEVEPEVFHRWVVVVDKYANLRQGRSEVVDFGISENVATPGRVPARGSCTSHAGARVAFYRKLINYSMSTYQYVATFCEGNGSIEYLMDDSAILPEVN